MFEPSQPRMIVSGLETNFSPSLSYSAHRSLQHFLGLSQHHENISHFKNAQLCQNASDKDYYSALFLVDYAKFYHLGRLS